MKIGETKVMFFSDRDLNIKGKTSILLQKGSRKGFNKFNVVIYNMYDRNRIKI